MNPPRPPRAPASARVRAALLIAAAADLLQIVIMPAFVPGALSPADDVLDLVVGAMMVWLLGWHVAFLPTFLAELIPGVDLFPSWTVAAWIVTRGRRKPRS